MYSYYVDFESKRLELWEKIIPSFTYKPEVSPSHLLKFQWQYNHDKREYYM